MTHALITYPWLMITLGLLVTILASFLIFMLVIYHLERREYE